MKKCLFALFTLVLFVCILTSCGNAQHTHYYTSSVTKEASCVAQGIMTYTCSCGDKYTESIEKTDDHDWVNPTCSSPYKCKICGATSGKELDHDYISYRDYKCIWCGKLDPVLDKCSLELPTLPKTVAYYVGTTVYSKVNVTNITYKFKPYSDGSVILTANFSGTKTYDRNGGGQSDSCKVGWKLYDPDGNVLRTGTFYSPNLATGEKFANKEVELIYNFDYAKPGKYKLVILDVN